MGTKRAKLVPMLAFQADSYWSLKEELTGLSGVISLLKADSIIEETKYWLLAAYGGRDVLSHRGEPRLNSE